MDSPTLFLRMTALNLKPAANFPALTTPTGLAEILRQTRETLTWLKAIPAVVD